jgi:hypothetical protein
VASFTTNELAVGSHILFAVYTGDGGLRREQLLEHGHDQRRQGIDHDVVAFLGEPSSFGQAVTFTATVDGPGTTTVPGTVQFKDGAVNLGAPQSLVLGQASLTIASLGGGNHPITAVYSGSASYLGSTSTALAQTVACDQLVTGTVGTVTAAPGESTCLSGAKVTGGISVSNGASLSIVNSTVTGGVTLTAPTTSGARIATVANTGSVTICGSTIGAASRSQD